MSSPLLQDQTVTARSRILEATAACMAQFGAAEMSMQRVADMAEVSKALIHYHFGDKERLIVEMVAWVSESLHEREIRALDGVPPAGIMDALWLWSSDELERGHIALNAQLVRWPSAAIQESIRTAARIRRETATERVAKTLAVLELRSRVPISLLAEAEVSFLDGLSLAAGIYNVQDLRASFDVFWLALFGLTE